MNTEINGWFQGDVVIRTAITEAIADLRRNPYLLDYIFASLPKDTLTSTEYGDKEVVQARKWFVSNEIVVFPTHRLDRPKFPCISIGLKESNEAEQTLSDTHYVVSEDNDLVWPALTPIFSPVGYTASTGTMTVPDAITEELILAPGMIIVDDNGVSHTILEVPERSVLLLAENTVAPFNRAVIKGAPPSRIATIESVSMKESYEIGCHVQGEAIHLTYLHSIISFILLRYKEALLEARGFERSTISSSDFRRNDFFESENIFTRTISMTGFVRQSWPKLISAKITGVAVVPVISSVDTAIDAVEPVINVDSADAWLLDTDSIG